MEPKTIVAIVLVADAAQTYAEASAECQRPD